MRGHQSCVNVVIVQTESLWPHPLDTRSCSVYLSAQVPHATSVWGLGWDHQTRWQLHWVQRSTANNKHTASHVQTTALHFSGWGSTWKWISNTTKPNSNSNEKCRISNLWTSFNIPINTGKTIKLCAALNNTAPVQTVDKASSTYHKQTNTQPCSGQCELTIVSNKRIFVSNLTMVCQ